MHPIALDPVQSVTITILLDNVFDGLLPNQGVAKRASLSSQHMRLPVATMEGGKTFDGPQAQHGFGALVSLPIAGRLHHILFDTGSTPNGLVENMRSLDLSPKDIETVVLSHGHFDHTAGLDGLTQMLGRTNLPLIIHPEFWNRRRLMIPGRDPLEIPTTSKSALHGVGFDVIEDRHPSFLLNGSLLITGEVDRTTSFEHGMPSQQAFRGGEWVADPLILDDQALVLNIQEKGLVVLTGCGHAGIINIVRYAQMLTGITKIYAILGGFHLSGAAFEPLIDQTCEMLAAFAPQVIVPTHCTGFRALHQLATRLPDAFIQSSVGTRFEL